MSIIEFIQQNMVENDPLLSAVSISILFLVFYDFYHALWSAILTWFKK